MDLDEVTKLVAEFQLSKSHDTEKALTLYDIDAKIREKHIESCLLAKVISPKLINCEAFQQHMPRILKAVLPIEVGYLSDNLFLMDFKSTQDKIRVLKGGPWNFFWDWLYFENLMARKTLEQWNLMKSVFGSSVIIFHLFS